MKHFMPRKDVTRRDVLKGMSALGASATLGGCSKSDDFDYQSGEIYKPELMMDNTLRCAFSTGPYDCGGSCVHKYHVKNERIVAMTSAGDIKRVALNENDPENPDEWDSESKERPAQLRACVRGYSYIARIYQPDRIMYPLMQTRTRGDINGFMRMSWEKAFQKLGEKLTDCFKSAPTLGYIPILWDWNLAYILQGKENMNLTSVTAFSNPSQGLIEAAKMDCVGQDMWRNSRNDRYNSGFIINWGTDPGRQSNWETNAYWTLQKAKEKGVDIISITPNCGATPATHSRNVSVNIPNDNDSGSNALQSSGKTVKIPGWLPIRPGTDGALLTAMMYVIYRRKLYDYEFLRTDSERNCFGFWSNDSVVSAAEEGTHGGFPVYPAGSAPWRDFRGETFATPTGLSFEEYIVSLEDPVGVNGWSPISVEVNSGSDTWRPANGGWLKGPRTGGAVDRRIPSNERDNKLYPGFDSSICHPDDYYGVLEYAARLTGVNSLIIEALACHFANNGKNKASLLDIGCGPQRAYNGAEYYWLAMCISAMCGHADKSGGGLGLGIFSVPDQFNIVDPNGNKETATFLNSMAPVPMASGENSYAESSPTIVVNGQTIAELILTGRDGRDAVRFKQDADWTTHGIRAVEKIDIKALFISAWNPFITLSNINKMREAYNKLDTVIYVGQSMTPSAVMCDFVFPETSDFEQNRSSVGGLGVSMYHDGRMLVQNVLKHNIYNVQPASYAVACYQYFVSKALRDAGVSGVNTEFTKPVPAATVAPYGTEFDDMDAVKKVVEGYQSSASYDRATGSPVTGLSYEKLVQNGVVSLPIPSSTPVIAMKHHRSPGGKNGIKALTTTTGYFNFYSPFWGDARIRRDHLITTPPDDNFSYPAGWRTAVAKYVPLREGYERFFTDNNPHNAFVGYKAKSQRTYTMQYITNKAVHRIHTNGGNTALINNAFRNGVYMNTSDAARRGIKDGQLVYVYNDRGCMKVPAIVSDYMAPGVVSIEHGAWYKPSTDPNETFRAYYESDMTPTGKTTITEISVPIDLGGSANILTDDMFVLDPIYVRNTSNVHGGPCEVSVTKPE